MVPPDAELVPLRAALLAWYDAHRRDLPWRTPAGETPDPYRVWLSEVMLQQTRVETVRPYFARWLQRFPTLADLADADADQVLKQWEGLGYYSRARNFHRAVREVRDRWGGRVPDRPADFRALPGVGRYTAGAVQSIAFGHAEPLVDGNVRRVFARWTDTAAPADAALWALAERLVPGERPGDLNQAVMELGATLCTPRNPRCDACPAAAWCLARRRGTQHLRPAPKPKRELPHEDTAVAVVADPGGRVLLVRRPEGGRLGGMWSFPFAVREPGEEVGAAAERAVRDATGLAVRAGEPIGVVEHGFTHVRVTYRAVRCSLLADALPEAEPPEPPEPRAADAGGATGADAWAWAWADAGELATRYALPKAQQRIAALAAERTLFDRIQVRRSDEQRPARDFDGVCVDVDDLELPEGVS